PPDDLMRLEVGSDTRPATGQRVSGDVYAAVPFAQGTLLCLADGLGHGPEADAVAERVCSYARAHAGEPLPIVLPGMHRALSGTRGAAVSLLSVLTEERRALFAGVGNVELRALARTRIAPPTSPGIVGCRMRHVREWEYPLNDGDLLVLMTDGIGGQ